VRSSLALALSLLALPSAAIADVPSGSGGQPAPPPGRDAETPADGGTGVGEVPLPERPERRRQPRQRGTSGRPILRSFAVRPGRFYIYGTPARVEFLIEDRSDTVRVRLTVRRRGERAPVAVIDLGEQPTGAVQRASLGGSVDGQALPQGPLELRLSARDPGGRTLRASARASSVAALEFYWHRFPLVGTFGYGGADARFGADRPSHTHQGQDLTAPEGTPVVAPRGGVVEHVAYQAEGAGHYVILDGAGEDRDYAFMHLQTGSIPVVAGQRVRTGELLGRVGSTGASSGPHLHFEVWEGGGWFEGGHPVDPLPYLRRWDAWS
jgi:murein DD-endopeptidase MepM/ murein hydrolase activator NlpD